VTIDPTCPAVVSELRHRGERRRAALARLDDIFAESRQLAQPVTDVLWPPSQEERRQRALAHLDAVFGRESPKTTEN